MRAPGDVLLVSTYELGHAPMGLASPLGFLARAGYAARGIDAAIDPVDWAPLAKAQFVGLSVPMHTALRLALGVIERIRAVNPAAHVCAYGLYAPLNRDILLARGANSVIGGEAEELLVETVRTVERGELAAPSRPPAMTRLAFTAPDRSSLPPIERYAKLIWRGEAIPAGYVEASRGCLHTCRHCPIPAVYADASAIARGERKPGRFFVVPKEIVLDDIGSQVAAGARHITLGDPDFLNGPTHAMAVVRGLHAAHPAVTFDITTKVEHVLSHAALFPELRALGCLFVVSAVESLSDIVLGHLAKGHTREDAFAARQIVEGAGVAFRPSFVPFTPWTTLGDYLELLRWIAREKMVDRVEPVQLAIRLLVPPGSLLLDLPAMRAHTGELEPESLSYKWMHPDPRMDALQREVMAIVEDALRTQQTDHETFAALSAHAFALAGEEAPRLIAPEACCPPAPRLSEAWFCCAEPTRAQSSRIVMPQV